MTAPTDTSKTLFDQKGYLMEGDGLDTPIQADRRPTHDGLKAEFGPGVYTFRYGRDMRLTKRLSVRTNKAGNLTVDTLSISEAEAMTGPTLDRNLKAARLIAKTAPALIASALRKLEAEHAYRHDLATTKTYTVTETLNGDAE